MKALLKVIDSWNTLGKNFSNLKTLTKQWLSELLPRFHFLLSYWQPAYSYGLISDKQILRSWQTPPQVMSFASLAGTHGQNATLRKKITNKVDSETISIKHNLKKLSDILILERFKIRIFNGLYTFWSNKRLRSGLLFLMVFAPISKFFYLLFPANGFGPYLIDFGSFHLLNTIEGPDNGWFFLSFRMYFFSIGELLAPTLSIFGIFLLFPRKYYPAYLVGVPFGYYLSMLIHRMFFVTNNQEFHNGFTGIMTFSFLLLGIVFFIVSDKVLFKENHRKRAAEARIIGLINMPGMTWDEKEDVIKKEVAEVMKVDNELFIKESA